MFAGSKVALLTYGISSLPPSLFLVEYKSTIPALSFSPVVFPLNVF